MDNIEKRFLGRELCDSDLDEQSASSIGSDTDNASENNQNFFEEILEQIKSSQKK